MKKIILLMFLSLISVEQSFARTCRLPSQWQGLCFVLQSRTEQTKSKMKLLESEATSLEDFLGATTSSFLHVNNLQTLLPKTTIELLMSIHKRSVNPLEAELMADYLSKLIKECQFQNMGAFDENTSHIIGREWHEIDYSNEGMTWQKQKAFYVPYGIKHFKSQECLVNFFSVESKLPYFKKVYKPLLLEGSILKG